MTAKQYCLKNPAIAYYSGFSGFEIHGFEERNGQDILYGVSGAWSAPSRYKYHRLKVYWDTDSPYFRLHNYKVPLNECIRMNLDLQ